MSTCIVLTVIGKDHPGIVNTLSEVLERHDGNWTESSMSSLAGQFAGILLATVPKTEAPACIAELESLSAQGLRVVARESDTDQGEAAGRSFTLDLVGHDRHGIVRDITQVFSRHQVNVVELETEVASASMAGGALFKAHAHLQVPDGVDIHDLEDGLEAIANELMVEFRPAR